MIFIILFFGSLQNMKEDTQTLKCGIKFSLIYVTTVGRGGIHVTPPRPNIVKSLTRSTESLRLLTLLCSLVVVVLSVTL